MHETLQGFFEAFAHSAVTADDLLCYLSHVLAGCPVGDPTSAIQCHQPSAQQDGDSDSATNSTRALGAVPGGSGCGRVMPWFQRLSAWHQEPGVQVVELYQSPQHDGATTQLQALLTPNSLPGQVSSGTALIESSDSHTNWAILSAQMLPLGLVRL